jgi:hypothetical protein
MAKFSIVETIHSEKVQTVRLGQTGSANLYSDKEVGKAVKLTAESRYELCAITDAIEGVISSVNLGTFDGYTVGGIVTSGYKEVTFDGSQAAGTGAIAVGTYVLVGTVTAKDTALTTPLKVRSATDQAAAKAAPFKARVVSLGSAGTGAVGTVGVIELL